MAAKQFAPDSLRQASSMFNGATDANYGVTPQWNGGIHSTHDLGMSFDLGVSNYINKDGAQTDDQEQLLASINALANNGWSLANAVAYTNHILDATNNTVGLPNIVGTPTNSGNDQVSAIRDFLSLYALTKSDGQAGLNGRVLNTTAQALLGGLISQVHIGSLDQNGNLIAGQNPYKNINKILEKLGITSSPVKGHHNHFHIYLKPPTPLGIGPANLLADAATAPASGSTTPAALQVETQGLLEYSQALITGEELMFTVDMPYAQPQGAPIVLAQAAAAGSTPQPDYILNTCTEKPSTGLQWSAMRAVDPAYMLKNYVQMRDRRPVELADIKNVVMLQNGTVGKITSVLDNTGRSWYRYDPPANYEGNDQAIFMAEYQGKRYKIVVEMHVFEVVDESASSCPPPKLIKVTNPTSGFNAYDINSITVTYSDLMGGAVGQTSGTTITLDADAAGHGWYVDPTPLDNTDDYLPTSNPNVWQAKAGTDAAGKMDLLNVLLHEYGHALGLEHSHDSGDFMAATLKPGERRLPSAEELQLMSQLVAELKGTSSGDQSPSNPAVPSLPLGALLLGRLALGRRPEDAVFDGSQALFAAHPTLQGGSLQNLQDWASQGNVTLASGGTGGATLQEGAASQTRLNQVFTINERDRFLSFTLAGAALDDVNGAPDDAFEVALLEADTGRSLTGALSLSRTDALLNLQANGTETAAANVTRVTNPDGSRTYRVDLAGIAAGTAVNLSFDLLGFGQAGSQVTVRDVRVSGLPQLHDDAATLAEDGTLAFDPFAQVDNAALLALGSQVVAAPALSPAAAAAPPPRRSRSARRRRRRA